ncbi:MAG: pilus assembly protein, partial [Anaerolineales bacterium]
PVTAAEKADLYRGMGLPPAADPTTNLATVQEVIREALARKTADLAETPNNLADDVPFVLGDVFHSNPVVTGGPANSPFFANNVNGYREFAQKHRFRRKMLVVGANDGQLHVFDAGIFRDKNGDGVADSNPLLSESLREEFDDGTGRELFAFVPRAALRPLKDLYAGSGTNRTWSVDGTVTIAEVRIDPDFVGVPDPDTPGCVNAPECGPEWRTVLIGGMREGGSAYYALDITQPDTIRDDDDRLPEVEEGEWVPGCFGTDASTAPPAGCGSVRFPAQLWEFTERYVDASGRVNRLDEDGEGGADLAQTWSIPNIGRIRVIENARAVDKYVAVFGGGLDTSNLAGNWLYMVDVETGQAIYKQELDGAAPSEPAAVDTDQDGYLDRVYIGTTRGLMYRSDLRGPNGELPELTPVTLGEAQGLPPGLTVTVSRILPGDTRFAPRPIFKAQQDAVTPADPPREIFFRPSVIYLAKRNEYALAFGVGKRNNLWSAENQAGRFYVVRDDVAVDDKTTFYTEANLAAIDPAAASSGDYLTDPAATGKGWFLPLRADEKLITNPFALSGVLVFTVFDPDVQIIPGGGQTDPTCRRTGNSRIFAVNATNASGLLYQSANDTDPTRFFEIQDFVTEPYIEQGQSATGPEDETRYPPLAANLEKVMRELQNLFPSNCKFANYRLDVKTLASDTGIIHIAPVPICIIEKNW